VYRAVLVVRVVFYESLFERHREELIVEINATKKVKVQAKTLRLNAKCSDCCSAKLLDQFGVALKDHRGYVPGFMPGDHYGDYIMLDIDIDTGQITNWKQPTAAQIEEFLKEGDDD
jgi:hypothetical protein